MCLSRLGPRRAASAYGSLPRAASDAAARRCPTPIKLLPAVECLLRDPHPPNDLRHRRPVSACFNANEICSSVNLLFFTAPLLPPGPHKPGKLAFMPEEKNGKTSTCSSRLTELRNSRSSPWAHLRRLDKGARSLHPRPDPAMPGLNRCQFSGGSTERSPSRW